MISLNQDPYELSTPKHWRIIHHIHGSNKELLHEFLGYITVLRYWSVQSLKHSGSETKYYHSMIQGLTSALWCEVLDCCSRGRLPSHLTVLGLTIGPHKFVTAVIILRHLYTQLKSTSKGWATKAQQDWLINVVTNSRLLAHKAE
jgi:hypothetical protein